MIRLAFASFVALSVVAAHGLAAANQADRVLLAQARPAAPPPPAPAEEDDPIEKCGAQRQPERVIACLRTVLVEAEKALDAMLKTVDAKIAKADKVSADEKAKWKAAIADGQAAFKRFVELDCDGAAAREALGQPGAGAVVIACKANHVRSRMADLEARYTE